MSSPQESPASGTQQQLSTLSGDLWYMIFELIEEDVQDINRRTLNHPILPLLLVSKTWKSIATPLMYRSAIFTNMANLEKFGQHLATRHWGDACPGDFVRHFRLYRNLLAQERPHVNLVTSLAKNLLSFTAMNISNREVVQIADTAALSLRSLDVHVNSEESIEPILRPIQRLTELRRLVFKQDRRPSNDEKLDGIDFLCLPNLTYLDVCVAGGSWGDIMAYFYYGHFKSLQHLVLYSIDDTFSEALFTMLRAHGMRLTHLDYIPAGIERFPTGFPKEALPNLEHVDLHDFDIDAFPEALWFTDLPASVRHLHIQCSPDECDGLADRLDNVICQHPQLPFQHIHLDNLSWPELLEDDPEEAAYLARSAQRLRKSRGISLVDKKGLTLRWILEPGLPGSESSG
ncbi:hypothetical protein CALVIDRAFT_599852 [Calocera viscosa TUFC12733]|uniref:F-box domain-containing protein n=1 Tax=Calocera viscosa (strain TUFC12733) TaxID=1330018 RepID=A0A167KBE9_CALVF|nr:hypothetical protein CALVIDRAFT_599852 [Calocera viscosa TUFC12733]